ncbi:MAG: tetratricopeptide repeat protein [Candidatus Saccharicenans sp.]
MLKNGLRLFFAVILSLFFLTGVMLAQSAEELIKNGDVFYAKWEDQNALNEYLKALQLEPKNYEALWKAARGYVDVADLLSGSGKEVDKKKFEMYGQAVELARRAIQVNPNDTWGHFFLSAALGKKVLLQGKKEQIDASKLIKAEIEKAIELDPKNDLAYHALGRWHRRMAEIGGAKRALGSLIYGSIPKGSFEESEKYLQKAVELNPEYINHHLELGRTYVAMKKYDQAEAEFNKCLTLPETSSKDKLLKEEARQELNKLNKKS